MPIIKTDTGRFKAIHKIGRAYCCSKVWDRKADAEDFLRNEKRKALGLSARASSRSVDDLLAEYLQDRALMVRKTTFETDQFMLARIPDAYRRRVISSVTASDVEQMFMTLKSGGAAFATVKRFRDSLRAFFSWLVKQGAVDSNVVSAASLPKRTEPKREMVPWSAEEFAVQVEEWKALNESAGNVAAVLAYTGLRWSEARALPGGALVDGGRALWVRRAQPEGASHPQATKNARSRRVPVPEPVRDYLLERQTIVGAEDRLLPPMWRGTFVRQLRWSETAGDRTIHDLRHTAICMWLQSGIDPLTVQTWAGHSDLQTLAIYTHYLGSHLERLSLEKLDERLRGNLGVTDEKEDASKTR